MYTLTRMYHFETNKKLERVAESFGAVYIDIRSKSVRIFDLWLFRFRSFLKIKDRFRVSRMAKKAHKTSLTSDEAVSRLYDAEYGRNNKPNYMYLNALLYRQNFEFIVGLGKSEIKNLKILDVGAGINELLRFCHDILGVSSNQLYGSDVSEASKRIIEKDGFDGYVGRLENLNLPENYFDLVFLSYFIDYDTNQRATFEGALRILRPGGKIILEGLFPSRPNGLLEVDKAKDIFITKGEDAAEDISLVCNAFINISKEQNKKIGVNKIVRASRYIHNQRGLNKLPSYFIVLTVST